METLDDNTLRLPLQADAARERQSAGPVLDVTRLWTGGLPTAAVAALVGLVGAVVVRVLFQDAPVSGLAARAFDSADTGLLCLAAAGASLAATGVAHLLLPKFRTPGSGASAP